mmetsp:Transcript_4954/g.6529  ORF Transcript_4954/g.6529 Transcript_4954/m.6529 type:complete len:89 (-) Transcript_4954:49-315(-)
MEIQECSHKAHDQVGKEILGFWKRHGSHMPTWARVVKQILILCATSAAVERLFSLLRDKFDQLMGNSLEDYIETSMMLNYNQRKVRSG